MTSLCVLISPPLYTSGSRRITLKRPISFRFTRISFFENSLFSSIAETWIQRISLFDSIDTSWYLLAVAKIQRKPAHRGAFSGFQEEMGELSGSLNIVTLGHNSTHSYLTAPHLWGICHTFRYLFLFLFQCTNKISFRFLLWNSHSLQTKALSQSISSITDLYFAYAIDSSRDIALLGLSSGLQSFLFGHHLLP